MKFFFATLLVLTTSWASLSFARTTYVTGTGNDMGYCSDTSCIYNIRSSSEREGQRQAEWNCQMQQGRPLSYTNFCSSSCSPNVIPPGQNQMVRCSSNCRMQCEVAN